MAKNSLEEKAYTLFHDFAHDLVDGQNHLALSNKYAERAVALFREEMKALLPAELEENGSSGKWVNGYNDCLKEIKERIER